MGRGVFVFAAACALAAAVATGAGAANPRTTTVMSINIYQGTELEHVVAAGFSNNPGALPAAVSADYGNAVATDFPLRAQALAQEILAGHPDLVGLQEVATWSVNGVVSYDFLQILLDALAARGHPYTPVIVRQNFAATAPDAQGRLIGLSEQTAIIARADLPPQQLTWSNPQSHDFTFRTEIPFFGGFFDLGGGWLSVDADVGGDTFRFVTTHMDPQVQVFRNLQAQQILSQAGGDGLPLVLVGDTNSTSDTAAYQTFVDVGGLTDAWAALHPDELGYTCCHVPPDSIDDSSSALTERVDYVLAGAGIAPLSVRLWNTRPSEMIGGLWPTDHAAIAATLLLQP